MARPPAFVSPPESGKHCPVSVDALTHQEATIPRRAWAVLALASLGQMQTTFAGSALNVGFPVISEDLMVERTVLAWTITGYSIAAAAFLLSSGRAADRVGGKRVFLWGLAVFTIGAVVAAISPNVGTLIVGRIFQGLGSAAMIPSSLSLALHEFPLERRSLAIGAWGGVAAIAGASGPPLGAALIELGSWRLVFVVGAVIGAATFTVGLRLLANPPKKNRGDRVDLISGPLAAVAVGLVVAALLQSSTWGWNDARIVVALVAAPVLLAAVVWRSRRHPTPLIDLSLFSNRRFVIASTTTTLYNAATAGYWLAAPLFLQTVWGWSVLQSGFGIVGGPLTHIVFARKTGHLADRGRHKSLIIAGTLVTAAGTAGIALAVTETSNYWLTFFPFTLLIGLGGSMAWPVFTSAALLDVDAEKYGQANGMNLTMRQLGGALGIAVVIAAIGNESGAGIDDFRSAWWIATIGLVTCAGVVAWWFPARESLSRANR
jgi:EmrB/QacA subfamily drug resistance transporter